MAVLQLHKNSTGPTNNETKTKIAFVVSHSIQHFCPQYASFAKHEHFPIKVFFGSALSFKKYVDANFKQEILWGNLRLNAPAAAGKIAEEK